MPRRARSTLSEEIKEEGSDGALMDVSGSISVDSVSADTSLELRTESFLGFAGKVMERGRIEPRFDDGV